MKETRRENLRKLLASPRFGGDRAKFCQDAHITKGRLAQLLDDAQPFGDSAERNLVEKLNLDAGFFSRRDYKLVAEPGEYKKTELTQAAMQIAALYDLIPEADLIKRAQGYSRASTAILSVLEDHKQQSTDLQAADQRKQSA
jgi:hypothetical protein